MYIVNLTFIMSNGEISDNTAYNGGGMYVNNGTFTMNSGSEISGNSASKAAAECICTTASSR